MHKDLRGGSRFPLMKKIPLHTKDLLHPGAQIRISIVFTILTLSCSLLAQTAPQTESLRSIFSSGERIRHELNEHGISVQGIMIYDWSKEFDPEQAEAGFGRYSLDVAVPVDGKKLWGLTGSTGMVRVRHHLNNFGEDEIGEGQLFSNIDASGRTTLYEAWIEQRLFSEKLRLKFGKIDANTEFAAVQTASDFLNSSMGYSPTILAFPTYPEPKLGFNGFYRPTTNNSVGVGIFQTANGGNLTIFEPARSWHLGPSENPGRLSAGYWQLGGSLARFDGQVSSGTNGFYGVLEQARWRAPDNAARGRRERRTLRHQPADFCDGGRNLSPGECRLAVLTAGQP